MSSKRHDHQLTRELDPTYLEAITPSSIFGMWVLLAFPFPEAAPRHSLEIMRWCWKHLNPVKASLQTSKILQVGQGSISLTAAWDKPPMLSFLCLLKLPSTKLEWPAFYFGLSLTSEYKDQFQIGKLQRGLPTNSYVLESCREHWIDEY